MILVFAGVPACGLISAGDVGENVGIEAAGLFAVYVLNEGHVVGVAGAVCVGDLAAEYCKEIAFEGGIVAKIGNSLYERDEGVLDEVFRVGRLSEFGTRKGEQPALESLDKPVPCVIVALADAF